MLQFHEIFTTHVSSDLEFVVVDFLAGESLLLTAKSAQPSSVVVVGLAVAQNGASKGVVVSVEAAKGLESHGFPVSMAVASVEPASITSSRWLNSAQAEIFLKKIIKIREIKGEIAPN